MTAATRRWLTTGEVAAMFRVDPKTVATWARAGKLEFIRTPGGHRRFPVAQFGVELLATLAIPTVQGGNDES